MMNTPCVHDASGEMLMFVNVEKRWFFICEW